MAQNKTTVAVSTFFHRCSKLIDQPEWLGAVSSEVSSLSKSADSGDVVIIATDPLGDGLLSAFIVASGGRLVYRLDADSPPEDENAFWNFASSNYLWVTPTLALRKDVSARVGGKADGQSFKLATDAIALEEFIGALAALAKPKPVSAARSRSSTVASPPEPCASPVLSTQEAVVPAPQESVYGDAVVGRAQVAELERGQTMSMF
jgi:hypothetical protein